MKLRRIVGVALAAILTLTTFTACGGSKADGGGGKLPDATYELDSTKAAWEIDDSKDNKLTWYVNAEWWNKKYGEDFVTKQVKKDLNLDIEFIVGDDTKLNTYFASGDIPDIVTIFDPNMEVARTADKWAYSLQDLADKYDPYFYEVAREDTLNWYKLGNGKTYGYPNYSNTAEDYDSGQVPARDCFIIRQDVQDAIGPQDFTTPDGFVKGMQAIKTQFPDLIPFGFNDFSGATSSLGNVVQDMLGVAITTDDDKYYDRNLDEDYLTWLSAFRQVHSDGNISDDSFTDDSNAFKEKVASGQYATIMMGSNVNNGNSLQTWLAENPDKEYIAVDAIQSTKGKKPTLSQAGISGWMINYISNTTKNPAKAIQVFTYLLSDYGEILTNFGIEGETFTREGDTITWTPEAAEVQSGNPEEWQLDYRIGEFITFGHDRFKALNQASYVKAVWQQQEWGQQYLTPQFKVENIAPDPGTAEARALTAITTNWNTTLVGLIRAKDDAEFDKMVEDYKAFLEDNSIKEINAIRDANIAKNLKKLGK
ncbi:MAG: sugar ABC transporter substrate-binding protein [Clostridiales Family XIII bacterium]|jgi:putative aldouronate transport system substrate-binding protein|nr:sugar ABC transporter substrate-binding protein [Clostridiales Family XIII bacterium]